MTAGVRQRVAIFGSGAMASLLGARLARSGRTDVVLVGSWQESLNAIERYGVTVEEGSTADGPDVWTARPRVARASFSLPETDFVVVLVKGPRTAAVAGAVARAAGREGLAATLQNGLGNRELLEAAAGRERVAQGVATLGATLLGPGRVRAYAGQIQLGLDVERPERVHVLAETLRAAGIPAAATGELEPLIWRKLAVNCAINAPAALLGVSNGELRDKAGDVMATAAREVAAVAAAMGVTLPDDPVAAAFDVAARTAGNRASMLQDVARGAPTEVEWLNGAVCRIGARLGVPTPANAALRDAVLAMEKSWRTAEAVIGR